MKNPSLYTPRILMSILLALMGLGVSYAHADVIIDNGGPGTSSTEVSSATGYYGSKSVWARDGLKYTWTYTPSVSGTYDVSMWWTELSSRSTRIPVSIAHADGKDTVYIDQQVNGGQWNVLGRYTFTAGQSYKVVITAQAYPTSTCADAVKFVNVDGGENRPPTAVNDTATTTEGGAVSINVASNDTDDGGVDITTVEIVGAPLHGGALSNGNGTVTYTPEIDFTGSDTFTYTVADSQGLVSNAATVTVTVNAVSTEYVIDNGKAGTSYTGTWAVSGASGSYGTPSVWARGGSKYTWTFTPAASGNYELSMWWTNYSSRSTSIPVAITHAGGTTTTTINQQVNGAQWNVLGTYAFTAGQSYTVVITSQASPTSTCADAVKFTYLSGVENMPPTAVNDAATTSMNAAVIVNVISNDTDDGTINPASVMIVTQPANGTVISNGDGTVTYTPDEAYTGSDSFTYTVADDNAVVSNAASVTITVTAGNMPPTAVNDSAVTEMNTPVTFNVVANDTDDGTIAAASVAITSSPSGGTVVSNGNGTVTYTPSSGFLGADAFTYKVADNLGAESNHATVTVTVNAASTAVVVDTGNSGTSSTGNWAISGATGYYGANSLWARDGATYTWSYTPAASGTYDVSMWWTEYSSRSTSIPVDITHAGGTTRVTINQQQNGGQWNSLGLFPLAAGVKYTVKITSQASPTSTCADAVKFTHAGDVGNLPPTAVIDSISPNPALPGSVIEFTGHGTDSDGGDIFAYSWRSSIDGVLSSSASFTGSNLSPGQHTIYFKVQDLDGSWSTETSAHLNVTSLALNTEHIYLGLMYGAEYRKSEYVSVLESVGAYLDGSTWKYTNLSTGMNYEIHFVTNMEDARQALYTENAHVLLHGHANYGLGGYFLQSGDTIPTITGVHYIDDDRIWNYSTKTIGMSIKGMITKQAYPNWWPEFQDGTSGIMPYDFNDPRGNPPYNYYITYRISGDPTHYKVETARNGAVERFSGSGATPWYASDGSTPSAANAAHREYFITNTDTSGDYGTCGASPCPKPHYGSKTIIFRKDLEIDASKLKYKRLMFHTCSSFQYFASNFTKGIVFYTLANVDGAGGAMYLRAYLRGKSDAEIWATLQAYQPDYDYYDFNKRPSEQ